MSDTTYWPLAEDDVGEVLPRGDGPFGQVLYHLAMGDDPQDLNPSLQHMVGHANLLLQPSPPLSYGLLGDTTRSLAADPAPAAADLPSDDNDSDDEEQAPELQGSDDEGVAQPAATAPAKQVAQAQPEPGSGQSAVAKSHPAFDKAKASAHMRAAAQPSYTNGDGV